MEALLKFIDIKPPKIRHPSRKIGLLERNVGMAIFKDNTSKLSSISLPRSQYTKLLAIDHP
jgi:hypothetical protein